MWTNDKSILLNYKPKILPFPKLHLTTVRNTIVKCTTCLASRMVMIKHNDGSNSVRKCPACKGTGETFINEQGLAHR